MKRYFLEYDVRKPQYPDAVGCYDHIKGIYTPYHVSANWNGNSMKTMKGYISRIKKNYAEQEPYNFRVYDYQAPDEPDGHVGCVYFQEK